MAAMRAWTRPSRGWSPSMRNTPTSLTQIFTHLPVGCLTLWVRTHFSYVLESLRVTIHMKATRHTHKPEACS